MSCYQTIDRRFGDLIDPVAFLETIHTGNRWAEGPVYFADLRSLIWSDIPNDRMLRWDEESGTVSLFRGHVANPNGNTRDREGRLVTCMQGERRVVRTEWDGSITVLADSFGGKRLNSPNDVVVKSDGSIWFSDPNYGIISDYVGRKGVQEQPGCRVYRIDPRSGRIAVVADDFSMPNGLAFSPDEKHLYISDSGFLTDRNAPHHVRVFDVVDDKLTNSRLFAEISPGIPDGFRVDIAGNLWISAWDGVQCHTPDGDLIGKILVPEIVANVVFGGPRHNRLFITATTSVYAVFLNIQGLKYQFGA
ncbi:SMP-30/gluconolactonase/LRE family protein [Labrys wisconsinensis]|uniref:Gluconolactonase n=1 Tax=Labrys wisconsinensis TaxID=425677 RepID=A0ABU0JJE0_9HYPH|nr:SMP-30/gluconolactonase/LRE family protein [Labrys wisconsinensis]MDQ0473252.1 gluconolactonase [Labrys wisconsinensis]